MVPRIACVLGLVAALSPLAVEAGPPEEASPPEVIEIEVEAPDSGWFPGLDDPRVQAYFRTGSMVGDSLFDLPSELAPQPLVRVGARIGVEGAATAAERREARRWARRMVAERLRSLESCYADARQREPIEASKVSLRVSLAASRRGPIEIVAGELGDADGNACLQGVLAFATRSAPSFAGPVELEVPLWFWLQTQRI